MINDKSDRIAMFSCIEFGEGNNCGADDWGELVEYRRLYPRMCCEATDQRNSRRRVELFDQGDGIKNF
jgi:hypothetical protein